jgi:NAD+ synthase (glutamine-hydrolysing)
VFVRLGVLFGIEELGLDGFKERFNFVPNIEMATTPEELVNRLLLCVYQGTRNSSETTRNAARTVAESVGAEFMQLDIDPIVQDYVTTIEKAVGHPLTWETDNIALQNIQARTRSPGAWLLANLRSALLLATGNRSEASVGYATMDGDTCGSLAPIGGIDKAFLRRFLTWLEKNGPLIDGKRQPMPFLSVVNAQAPTAELKPTAQTDEGDLMPYDVLHRIELLGLYERKNRNEILEILQTEFSDHSVEQLGEWIDKFFRLWNGNQWKRCRYAMSFRLDDTTLNGDYPVLVPSP